MKLLNLPAQVAHLLCHLCIVLSLIVCYNPVRAASVRRKAVNLMNIVIKMVILLNEKTIQLLEEDT